MIPISKITPSDIYSQEDAPFLLGNGFSQKAARQTITKACLRGDLKAVMRLRRYWFTGKEFLDWVKRTFGGGTNSTCDNGSFLEHRVQSGLVADSKRDRIVLSAFFNFLRYMRWYRDANPAEAALHKLGRPRRERKKVHRTTKAEDMVILTKGPKSELWPMLLLTRWAGLRRGEACTLRWS